MRFISLILLSTIGIAGCVATYQPKPGSATAIIRVTTNTDDNSTVFIFDAKGCESALAFMGPQALSRDESMQPKLVMGSSPQPDKRTRERTLQAGERIQLVAMSSSGSGYVPGVSGVVGYSCKVGVTFTPRANSHYELQYSLDAAAKKCGPLLNELRSGSAGQVIRVPESSATYFQPGKVLCTNR